MGLKLLCTSKKNQLSENTANFRLCCYCIDTSTTKSASKSPSSNYFKKLERLVCQNKSSIFLQPHFFIFYLNIFDVCNLLDSFLFTLVVQDVVALTKVVPP